MSWQEFLVRLVDAMAWPVAIVTLAMMLRGPINAILTRFSGAEATTVEVGAAGMRVRLEREVSRERDEALATVEAASHAATAPRIAELERSPLVHGDPVEDDALDAIRQGGRGLLLGLGQLLVNDLKTLIVEGTADDLFSLSEVSRRAAEGMLTEKDEASEVIELALRAQIISSDQRDRLVLTTDTAFDISSDMPPTPILVHYVELSWGLHAHLVRQRRRPPRDTRGLYRDPAPLFVRRP